MAKIYKDCIKNLTCGGFLNIISGDTFKKDKEVFNNENDLSAQKETEIKSSRL